MRRVAILVLLLFVSWFCNGQTISPSNPAAVCNPGTVALTVTPGSTTITAYQWIKDGAYISGAITVNYTAAASGNYGVKITTGPGSGDTTLLGPVTVTIHPRPAVTVNSDAICLGQTATLTASGANSYSWSPATNLNTTIGTTVNANPATTTTYIVTGTETAHNCSNTANAVVTVKPKPIPSFTYSPTTGCLRKRRSIQFNSTSTSNGSGNLSYSWNFGDPNSGTENASNSQNPIHSFVGSGFSSIFSTIVTLTVTSSNGCSSTTQQNVSIGTFPDATLTDPYNFPEFKLCNLTTNNLTVKNSSSTTSTNTFYEINWGDGNTFSSTIFDSTNHTYNSTGFKNLLFIVSSGSCKDTTEYNVYIGSNPGVGLSTSGNTTYLCLPSTKTFFIDTTRTTNNPIGTIYTVTFNDGSPDLVFTHPPPPSFDHTFINSSCGAPATLQPNTFVVTIYASNPCGTTPGTVGGITTVLPPNANFSVSPDTIICTTSTAIFTNTSTSGSVVVQNGSGPSATYSCDSSSSVFWSISAISGVPNSWTIIGSSSQSMSARFPQPGTYSITMIVRNNANAPAVCRFDTITKTICVQAPPTPSFTATPTTSCNPLVVNFTNTSTNLPTCGVITRKWTVIKTGSTCIADSARDYAYISGTDSTSLNPVIRLNNEGRYSVVLTITNACGPFTSPAQTFIVKRKPQVNIALPDSVCAGVITPAANALSCEGTITDYNWLFNGGTPASSTILSPGNINYNTAGSYPISLAVTNECGVTTVAKNLVVKPTPVIVKTRDTGFCAGQTVGAINFSSSVANTIYSWINDNTATGIPAAGNGNILSFIAANGTSSPISSTIIVTPSLNGCTGVPDTFVVTVNPVPALPQVTDIAYCQNAVAAPLTATANGSNVLSWFTVSSGGVALAAAPIPLTTTAGTTNYYVSQTNTITGCQSGRAPLLVTVKPSPSITGVLTNPSACATANGYITLSGVTAGSLYQGSYTFNTNPATGFSQTASAANTITIANLLAGAYSNITVTLNGCPSQPIGPFNLSDPSAPAAPTASGTSPLCSGQILQLNASTGSAGAVYTWSGPNGFASNTQNPSIANITTGASGTYTVSITVASCTSPAVIVVVQIDSTPATPVILANSPVCTDSTLTLAASTASSMGVSWQWTGPNSFSSTQANVQLTNVTAAASGTYSVKATAIQSTCASQAATVAVIVNITPLINGSSAQSPNACNASNGAITLTGLTNGSYTVYYTKNGSVQIATISAAGGSLIVTGLGSGTYDNVYVVLNGCPSNKVGPFNLTDPNPPSAPVVINNSPVCSGDSVFLKINAPVVGAIYTWSGPNGFSLTGSSTTATVLNAGTNAGGTYSVTATVSGCTSPVTTALIVVHLTPGAPLVTTPVIYCQQATAVALSATALAGNTLNWYTVPSGGAASLVAPVPSTSAIGTVTYYVSQVSADNCEGPRAMIEVVVNPTAVVPNQQQTICSGTAFTISPSGAGIPSATTYSWGLPVVTGGITGSIAGTNVASITGTLSNPTTTIQTATYTVTPATGACNGNTFTVTITVNPAPRVDFSPADQIICSGESTQAVNLTSLTLGANISWVCIPPLTQITGVVPSGTTTIPVQSLVNLTTQPVVLTYTALASTAGSTSCPGDSSRYLITVNPKPRISDTAISVCSGAAFNFAPLPTVAQNIIPAGTIYKWTVSTNAAITGQQNELAGLATINQTLLNATNFSQSVIYTITPMSGNSGNCEGPAFNLTVTVNPQPVIADTAIVICSGTAFNMVPSGSVAGNIIPTGTNYTWTVAANANITGQSDAPSAQAAVSQTLENLTDTQQQLIYTVTPASGGAGNCTGPTFKLTVTVNPTPKIAAINVSVCSDSAFNVSPSAGAGNIIPVGTIYTWTVAPNVNVSGQSNVGSGQTVISQTLVNATNTVQQVLYTVTPKSGAAGNCVGVAFTITVNVNPTPFIADTIIRVCSGTAFQFSPAAAGNNVPAGITYSWSVPLVTGGLTGAIAGNNEPVIAGLLNNPGDTTVTAIYTIVPMAGDCPGNSFVLTILINPSPKVQFSVTPQTVCSGTTTQAVTLISPSPGVQFSWTCTPPPLNEITGVITSGTGVIPTQTLQNLTANPVLLTYIAAATTTGASACPGSPSSYTITVNPSPTVQFSLADQVICSGVLTDAVILNSTSSNVNISWSSMPPAGINNAVLSGTNTIPIQSLVNTTNTPLTVDYIAVATTTGDAACPGTSAIYSITVNPTPDISATPGTQTICSGTDASVVINSSVAGTTFSWTFTTSGNITGATNGNGNQIIQNLTNSSTLPQTVTYLIRATNVSGGVQCDGATISVTVTVNPSAVISNTPLTQAVCNNLSSALVSWTSQTPGASFSWSVSSSTGIVGFTASGTGDLPAMTLLNPSNTPLSLIYAVTTSLAICPGSAVEYTIVVNPDAKAMFTQTVDTACWPFALVLQNVSPSTSVGNYEWYANNNPIGTSSNFPGYIISLPGDSAEIKLVANSLFGCKNDSTTHWFYTKPKPKPIFDLSKHAGCGPLQISFNNRTALLDTFSYRWDFGNGVTSSSLQPLQVTFQSSPNFVDTTYYISLTAFNECDTVTYTDSVVVFTGPKARLGVPTTFGCSPFTLDVTNTSLGGPATYYWDFGNGHKDTTLSTGVHTYTYYTNQVDTFTVMLIAENQCGRDTQMVDIRVAPNSIRPQVSINASELFGCLPHTVNFINSSAGATTFTWNFDDGSTPAVTTNTQFIVPHTFIVAGTFNVKIDMTNGCSDTTITRQVVVYPKPLAAFNTAAVYCLGDTIRIANTSQNAINYQWFWGDGQTVSGFEPTHLYANSGSYNITMRAEQTNSGGLVCYDTVTHPVSILVQPDVTLQSNVAFVNCAPFTFNAVAPGIINETVTWYINDTALSTSPVITNGISVQYTFNKPGTFVIKMVAVNAAGCRDSSSRTVVVRGTPVANFTPLNLSVCVRDTTVAYLNSTTFNDFGPLTYRWLVDAVLKGTNGNFTYQYFSAPNILLPRIFTTQLIATNSVGCSDTAVGTLQMNPNAKAQFSLGNTNQCVPFILPVNNASQYATKHQWYLNGVLVDTAANPAIVITQALTAYRLRLIADNGFSCRPDTFELGFTSRIKPIAAFVLSDTLGCTGVLNVATTNRSSNANSYVWDWGDATAQSSFTSPSHLYNTQGQYVISLVASDGVCKDTAYRNVYVSQKPVVDFSVNDSVTCDTARIHFTNLTSGATGYLWSFSDGTTSTAIEPDKNFPPSLSYYTVRLVAYNAVGCRDSVIKPNLIFAKVPPAADFVINPSPVIAIPQYTFSFDNITTNNNQYTYLWNLGDGSFESTRDVVHKYADTGSYEVRLVVFDNNSGCPDTVIKIATIQGAPGYLYVPNAFYPNSLQQQFKTFKPLGKGLAAYTFQVFDAWGKLLFQSSELDAAGSPVAGWDGTFKGTPMPQNAYAWRISAKFRNGRQWDGMSYSNNLDPKPGNTFGTVTLFR